VCFVLAQITGSRRPAFARLELHVPVPELGELGAVLECISGPGEAPARRRPVGLPISGGHFACCAVSSPGTLE